MQEPESVHDELGLVIVDVPDVDSEVEVGLEGGGHAEVVGFHPHLVHLLPLAVQRSSQGDLMKNEEVKHADDDEKDLVGHLSSEGVHDEGEMVAQGVLPDTVPEGEFRRIKEN